MKILVTGGAGYIGSTICSALEDAGHQPIILDSLITGRRDFIRDRIFYHGDIADKSIIKKIFLDHPDLYCTIHCAALILVTESMKKPYEYYKENVSKSNELFHALQENGCPRVVFSSSASIYEASSGKSVTENAPLAPVSPYAKTKYMIEMILDDFCKSYHDFRAISLRYFNPIGADPLLRSGYYTKNPTHILPRITDVVSGKSSEFFITGTTWPTRDGSGIRDYIHVWDLAKAHVRAVEKFTEIFARCEALPHEVINIGTGEGVTVKEFVAAFERVIGKKIPCTEMPPRPGDVAGAWAAVGKAESLLAWKATHGIEDAMRDALKWNTKEQEKTTQQNF